MSIMMKALSHTNITINKNFDNGSSNNAVVMPPKGTKYKRLITKYLFKTVKERHEKKKNMQTIKLMTIHNNKVKNNEYSNVSSWKWWQWLDHLSCQFSTKPRKLQLSFPSDAKDLDWKTATTTKIKASNIQKKNNIKNNKKKA